MGRYDQEKEAVLNCANWLCEHGYFGGCRGSGGNISVRINDQNVMAITPSGQPYHEMLPEDICVIDFDQKPVEGQLKPSIEASMHIGIYQHRPNVGSVIHTHSIFASTLSIINQPIPALLDEITFEIGDSVAIVPYAISGSSDLAQNVADKLDNHCFCYIIQNHGALSLGKDIDQAWKNAELLEKAAQVYYYALTTGRNVTTLPKDAVARINKLRRSKSK